MSVFGTQIDKDATCVFAPGIGKRDALNQLTDALGKTDAIRDPEAFRKAVFEREAITSTGIGQGVAIPHVRSEAVTRPIVGVGVSQEGIPFDAMDNEPVHVVIMFAMPAGSQKEYLGLLAQVMFALKKPGFLEDLTGCCDCDQIAAVVNEA